MNLQSVTLENEIVRLVPLTLDHAKELGAAAADGALWEPQYSSIPLPNEETKYIQNALNACDAKICIAFAVIEQQSGDLIGTTRLYHYDEENERIMLGYTWYAKRAQGSKINPSCKLLVLAHAFEMLNCSAVEFQVDSTNERSLAAVKKLGAKQDGILRNHKKRRDGSYRDTVSFSITREEWPHIKQQLQQRVA